MALKLGAVDSKALTLSVERAVTDGGRVKDCKTHEVRIVDLTPDLAGSLRKHLTWLRAEGLRAGSGEPEWLFPREDGSLMDKDHLANVFQRSRPPDCLTTASTTCGTPTRHCCWLRARQITYVAAQLGHSSPATTMRYYARWIPSKGRRWVDVLDRKTAAKSKQQPKSGTSASEA